MRTVTAIELRKSLGSVLDDVAKKKERVVIERTNRPLAVLISVEEFEEKVLRKDRSIKLKAMSSKMDAWRKRHGKEASRVDVVKAVRSVREGR